jgi:hypothetical protein
LGYGAVTEKMTLNFHAGLFHDARNSSIQLTQVIKTPQGKFAEQHFDFQNFSENRNGFLLDGQMATRRFVIGGDASLSFKKRSYLIMGDYNNDGVYDYNQDGKYNDNDYEYGYFRQGGGPRLVGFAYARVKLLKQRTSPWIGIEVVNINQKRVTLPFKEFQTPLPNRAQVRVRIMIPLGQGVVGNMIKAVTGKTVPFFAPIAE